MLRNFGRYTVFSPPKLAKRTAGFMWEMYQMLSKCLSCFISSHQKSICCKYSASLMFSYTPLFHVGQEPFGQIPILLIFPSLASKSTSGFPFCLFSIFWKNGRNQLRIVEWYTVKDILFCHDCLYINSSFGIGHYS